MSDKSDLLPTMEKDRQQQEKEIEAVEKEFDELFDELIEPNDSQENVDQPKG